MGLRIEDDAQRGRFRAVRTKVLPTTTDIQESCLTFLRSKGKGKIEFKCELQLVEGAPDVGVAFAVGRDEATALDSLLALNHNFSRKACCRASDEWAFSEFLDPTSQFFVVVVEISELNYTVQSPCGSSPRFADSSLGWADMDTDDDSESFNQRCAETLGKKEQKKRWSDMADDDDDEEKLLKFEKQASHAPGVRSSSQSTGPPPSMPLI